MLVLVWFFLLLNVNICVRCLFKDCCCLIVDRGGDFWEFFFFLCLVNKLFGDCFGN